MASGSGRFRDFNEKQIVARIGAIMRRNDAEGVRPRKSFADEFQERHRSNRTPGVRKPYIKGDVL